MKLQIRAFPGPVAPHYVLTDRDGIPLPGQRAVSWSQDAMSLGEVTVTFAVDGADISLHDKAPEAEPVYQLPEAFAAFAALSPANRNRFLSAIMTHKEMDSFTRYIAPAFNR